MKKLILIITAVLIMAAVKAQTNVSGGIYANTVWTQANSPYIVTGNIVVFPSKTLSIQPGVVVKFDSGFKLEIRGTLIAKGNATDSIRFISNTSPSQSAWNCIDILNSSQNASASFEYCVIKHSTFGVQVECCWGNSATYIKHSTFDNNTVASAGYAGWVLPIDNCVFTNNMIGVSQADKKITNSVFKNNDKGVACERYEVHNSIFQNNNGAIIWEAGTYNTAIIDSCSITNNTLGIQITGGSITNCDISNNSIGIFTQHQSYLQGTNPYYIPVKNNKICYNSLYNIKNGNTYNKDVTGNCFCFIDSAAIENKLYDGYDDITIGLFNYDIYDTTCQTVVQSVYKIGDAPNSINELTKKLAVSVSPNPFSTEAVFRFDTYINNASISVYNVCGQQVREIKNISGNSFMFQREDLASGLYFVHVKQGKNTASVHKVVITNN